MSSKTSINILLGLITLVTTFHLCIIVKAVPYTVAWGGRLQNDSEMYVFETVSILINVVFAFVLLIKGEYLNLQMGRKTVNAVLWVFFIIFALNTIGNLFAKTLFEKSFAFLTLLFALLILNILRKADNPGPYVIRQ